MLTFFVGHVNALILGLFAGSLLLEGLVLVPFWRKLSPAQFFDLHHEFGKRLFSYFAPLTTLAALLPIALVLLTKGNFWFADIAAIASVSVLAFFPLYFQKANLEFANRAISDDELPSRLRKWAQVHAMRSVIAIVAFGAALASLPLLSVSE